MYWLTLLILAIYAIFAKLTNSLDWVGILHLAYYLPAVAMLSVISGQIDLLSSIQKGGVVNLRARILDFTHWLMLIGVNIGAWMIGGVTILWFILKLILLAVIGWQIGAGIKNQLKLQFNEKVLRIMTAIAAFLLGLFTGYIRNIDSSIMGWGWFLETITAVVAILIVIQWIWHDIKTISKDVSGYPRSFFLKGIFGNSVIFLFWIHIMIQTHWNWEMQAGLSFNVLIGNIIYIIYWLKYESCRWQQG